jgi:hypothetical protein
MRERPEKAQIRTLTPSPPVGKNLTENATRSNITEVEAQCGEIHVQNPPFEGLCFVQVRHLDYWDAHIQFPISTVAQLVHELRKPGGRVTARNVEVGGSGGIGLEATGGPPGRGAVILQRSRSVPGAKVGCSPR